MKKKLNCHCGSIEAEVEVPEKGIEKVLRCNCSICKKNCLLYTSDAADE